MGQEQYQNIIPIQYIRDSAIVLLIFCNINTLDDIKRRWIKYYKENSNIDNARFILVGNKSDIFGEERDEIVKQGEDFAEEINAHFMTCSAKSADNMDNLENYILTEARRFIDQEEIQIKKDLESEAKSIKLCKKCGRPLSTKDAEYCQTCIHEFQRKCEWPSRNELKNLIRSTPFLQIGKKYNVSDNTVRKWCLNYGLPSKKMEIKAISDEDEEYVAPENGSNIYLTIDTTIQGIAEKYLKQAVEENNAGYGGVIMMDPQNGEIKAMANYPDYDLNSPFTPNENLSKDWDTLSAVAKSSALQSMWRNTAVSNTYEPGSVFKVLISAIALEENVVDTDTPGIFSCIGYQDIYGTIIKCAKTAGHGYQSLREALEHSCNPAFMQLGAKIGKETLYKYFEAFGLNNRCQ